MVTPIEMEMKAYLSIEEHLRALRDDALGRAENEAAQALGRILASVSGLRAQSFGEAETARGDPSVGAPETLAVPVQ